MSHMITSIFPDEIFLDLRPYQYGMEQCDPCYSFGPAIRSHFLFHYIISGTGTLSSTSSDGITRTWNIHAGEGFMIFPQQVCTYTADEEQPWHYIWVEFDGLRAKELIEQSGLSMESPVYQTKNASLHSTMYEEMHSIIEHREDSPFQIIGHLYLFADALVRSCASAQELKPVNQRDFYIRQAMSFIEQNYQHEISVEDIAAVCRLNRSYFGKIFHEHVGKSPQEFLISYRMSKAADLLRLTALPIGEISVAVGYPNQLHFSRAFKNVYDVSPRQWRNEHCTKDQSDLFFQPPLA